MATGVEKLEAKSFDQPDETKTPPKAHIDVINVGGLAVSRFRLEPGWTWAESVKPIAKTDRCEVTHIGYCTAGALEVWRPDGSRVTIRAGQVYAIPAGHDARVVGEPAYEGIEFSGDTTFAKG